MRNLLKVVASFLLVAITFFYISQGANVAAASKYADGQYNVPFTVLKGDSDERSMTNDYLTSPAKLIVKDGKNLVQVTLKNSSWWKEFSVSTSAVTVISDSNDTRVVQFEVPDLDQVVGSKIHVVVPDINYDNHYDVRFKFDTSGLAAATGGNNQESGQGTTKNDGQNKGQETGDEGNKAEKNPQTGDHTPIVLLTLMFVGSAVFLARKFVPTK